MSEFPYLDKIHEGFDILRRLRAEFVLLSEAANLLGLHKLSESLAEAAHASMAAHDMIREGVSEMQNNSLRASEEATGNLLTLAISMATKSVPVPNKGEGQ